MLRRYIQSDSEESSVFYVVKVWVIVRKKSSYKHLSNSEWLTGYSCLTLQTQNH
jgi:hypothetical protein